MTYIHPHESQEMRLREKIRRLAEKQPEVADVLDALVDFQKLYAPIVQPGYPVNPHDVPTMPDTWTPTIHKSFTLDASGNLVEVQPPQDKQP